MVALEKEKGSNKNTQNQGEKVDASEWGIEIVDESKNSKKEVFVSKEEVNSFTLEELMGKIKTMSLNPNKN